MDNIIKIIKSLEDWSALIDEAAETVKHETIKQEDEFLKGLLGPLAASIVQPVISLVLKVIRRRGVRRTGRGYLNKNL